MTERKLSVPLDRHEQVWQFDDALDHPLHQSLVELVGDLPVFFMNRAKHFKTHEFDILWYNGFAYAQTDLYTDNVEPQLDALDPTLAPIAQCWQSIKQLHDYPVRLYDAALSSNTFGTEGNYHHDIPDPARRALHHTALVYCCTEWKVTWAGETLVFDEHENITAAAMPKPNRVLIIKGDPLHVGRSVSRICPVDRRVLAFKYWRAE